MRVLRLKQIFDEQEDFGLLLKSLTPKRSLRNEISHIYTQRPGLALAGFAKAMDEKRIQILGKTELDYLSSLKNRNDYQKALQGLCMSHVPCLILSGGRGPSPGMIDRCKKAKIALLQSDLSSIELQTKLELMLEQYLSPSISVHGVLVDVYGVGILIVGQSGIGKSECALELITRGHRLISDDLVLIHRKIPELIIGSGNPVLGTLMEIRGIGIIDIKELFGIHAVRKKKRVECVIELLRFSSDYDFDRLGDEERKYQLMDVELPFLQIPVSESRVTATQVEIAAKNHLLKLHGTNTARDFVSNLNDRIKRNSKLARISGDSLE